MEMGATVAFQEDGSWQNEAEQRLRIRQVKESRSRLEAVETTDTTKTFNLGLKV